MGEAMVLNMEDFRLPEEAKVTRVIGRLRSVYASMQENDEAYSETYSEHSNSYGIGF